MTIRTVLVLALLLTAVPAGAQSTGGDSLRKENAIASAGNLLRPIVIGRAMDPAALYGARICALEYQLALFQDGLELERRNARESGVIDLREAREQGEAIVSIRDEIKDVRAKARERKVAPAKCSSKLVQPLLCESQTSAACRTFERDDDDILLYSLGKKSAEAESQALKLRDALHEKAPHALASVEAEVIAALTLAGIDVEPVKAWFAAAADAASSVSSRPPAVPVTPP